MRIEALGELFGIDDLGDLIAAVDERVHDVVGTGATVLSVASSRVADAGGKRLRPVLTMAFAHLGSSFERDAAVAGGAAIELVQVGSLVHDDLFEQASTRRRVPTINAVEGENVAVLAGDFILAKAAEQATLVGERFAEVLARTVTRLCEGQLREMRDQYNVERTVRDYFASIAVKTAVLFAAACTAGAHAGSLDEDDASRAERFGLEYGMAYQLIDDVLDFVADPDVLGKPVGIDVETGVYTLPVLLAIRDGHDQLATLLKRHNPADLVAAREVVLGSNTLRATVAAAREHWQRAADIGSTFGGPIGRGLVAFPGAYFRWALTHFAPNSAPAEWAG